MDFGTIGGIAVGLFLLVKFGLGDTSNIPMFIDPPSMAITFGGAITAMFTAYPFATLKTIFGVVKFAFIPQKRDIPTIIKTIISFAEQARREGILALENRLPEVNDPFLKKGIQLAVDGTDQNLIREILQTEMDNIEARHKGNTQMFDDLAAFGPAFGMIGTLVGLVLMLANMSDPSAIGPAMAVALITTFYGALMANMFAIPLGLKLKGQTAEEMMEKNIMLEGILSLQAGENPRIVEWKLMAYLDPDSRLKIEADKEKEKKT